MKKFIFFLFFIFCFHYHLSAQYPIDETTGKVCYTEVIETDLTKDQLYANAQAWIINTFGEYNGAVLLEDKEDGKIILRGNSEIASFVSTRGTAIDKDHNGIYGYIYIYIYIIAFECKDYKYRYSITDIDVKDTFLDQIISFEEELSGREYMKNVSLNKYLSKKENTKLSKKEKKELKYHIDRCKISIKEDEDLAIKDSEEFNSLCNSLKSAMNIHRDF